MDKSDKHKNKPYPKTPPTAPMSPGVIQGFPTTKGAKNEVCKCGRYKGCCGDCNCKK